MSADGGGKKYDMEETEENAEDRAVMPGVEKAATMEHPEAICEGNGRSG